MRVDFSFITDWMAVRESARTTINKGPDGIEPSSDWKRKMLLAEHSPIRQLIFRWKWHALKSWISVHFVRHHNGIEHYVSTQRSDRTGEDRNSKRQDAPVNHECLANAQAIINTSRKRLCRLASSETQEAWHQVLDELHVTNPELHSVCVPDCVYRGHCFELKSCGFYKTAGFKNQLDEYRKSINPEEGMPSSCSKCRGANHCMVQHNSESCSETFGVIGGSDAEVSEGDK